MAVIGVHVTCWNCGGGVTTVNPGATCGTQAAITVACGSCQQEWAVIVLMRHVATDDTARLDGDHRTLAARVDRLVAGGMPITRACAQIGIPVTTYRRHRATPAAA